MRGAPPPRAIRRPAVPWQTPPPQTETPRPATVVFSVKDNGIGIAPLDLPRLFEKFYRSGRREAHAQKGSGLGLAIVKSIAERHGGKVWVESQLGKGSVFYLEIPLAVKK